MFPRFFNHKSINLRNNVTWLYRRQLLKRTEQIYTQFTERHLPKRGHLPAEPPMATELWPKLVSTPLQVTELNGLGSNGCAYSPKRNLLVLYAYTHWHAERPMPSLDRGTINSTEIIYSKMNVWLQHKSERCTDSYWALWRVPLLLQWTRPPATTEDGRRSDLI